MYKALYPYTNKDKSVLSFQLGDEFNLIEQIDEHWWSMLDSTGIVGLVPASYLEVNQISKSDVIEAIDNSIRIFHKSQNTNWNETVRRNIQKLELNREAISKGHSLWIDQTDGIPQQPKREAPKGPNKKRKSTKKYSAPPPPSTDSTPTTSPRQLIDSTKVTLKDQTDGASSKVYNIQVKQGDISPLNTKQASSITNPVSPHFSETVTSPNPYAISAVLSKETLNSTDVIAKKDSKLNKFEGSKITISRMSESGFKTITSSENSHSISQGSGIYGDDGGRTSITSDDTISRDSFTSSSVASQPNGIPSSQALPLQNMNCAMPEDLGKQLIDAVRSRSKMSFNKSLAAVRCVLHTIANEVPSIADPIKKIQKQIEDDKLNVFQGSLAEEDANRLYDVLDKLTEHKEDSQQRNWAIHEDFTVIKDLLDNLMSVMDEIDPSICRSVLEEDEYRYMNDLIVYYQMESRAKLRISLLHAFGCFCQLGRQFITQLLCSVLPTELAQDIMQDQKDILKFVSSSFLLTIIFSTGEPVPYHHYVQFNEDFIDFLLNQIEDPPNTDTEDEAADSLVALLLSYNQHFKTPRTNTIMQVMSRRTKFRTLSEKVLLLLNRETDPAALFEFNDKCPDSVVKFLMDVFSAKETSDMFFTNDLFVLFDIILRQLTDRQKKDKIRTEYLSLFHSILNTTKYHEHKHRCSDFKRCFLEILHNSETESEVDVYIVGEIMSRFSKLFY